MAEIYESNYSNICRLCLTNHKFNVQIFGNIGDELQIDVKIRTCLPVKVSKNDGFPSNICYKCLYYLETFYNFRNTCLESEKYLHGAAVKGAISKNDYETDSISSTSSSDIDFQFMLGPAVIDSDDSKDGEPAIKFVPCVKNKKSQLPKNSPGHLQQKNHIMQNGNSCEVEQESVLQALVINETSKIKSPEIKTEETEAVHNDQEQHLQLNNLQDENSCDFVVPRREFDMDFQIDGDDGDACFVDVEMINSCHLLSDNLSISTSNTVNRQGQNISQENTVPKQNGLPPRLRLQNDNLQSEVPDHNQQSSILPSGVSNRTSSILPSQHIENSTPESGKKKAQHWLSQLFKDKEQSLSNSSGSQHTLFSFRSRSSSEDIFKGESSGHSNLTPVYRQDLNENREMCSGIKNNRNLASGHRSLSSLEYYSDSQLFSKRGNLNASYLQERRQHNKVAKGNAQEVSKNFPDFKTWCKNTQTEFPHWKSNVCEKSFTEPSTLFNTKP